MHIFIDESGSFAGYHKSSVSVVGALSIPDGTLEAINRRYQKIRPRLPTEKGEVKGRLLDEEQIDEVVTLLLRNEAILEITAIDLGLQTEDEIADRKRRHAEEMLARAPRFREPDRQEVEKAAREILKISLPLYVQAIITFETLRSVINHVPLYFAQRRPQELGQFSWIIDGKDPKKVTNWEMWWSWYAVGALATMSRYQPQPVLEGADYTFYDRFKGRTTEPGGKVECGTDLKLLLNDLRFCSTIVPGLELVDIITNAVRRALTGNLGENGWRGISRLMIHRKEPYIKFILLKEGADQIRKAKYASVVNRGFSTGGKLMVAPKFRRMAAEEGCE